MFITGSGSGSRNGHVDRRAGWWHMFKFTKREEGHVGVSENDANKESERPN